MLTRSMKNASNKNEGEDIAETLKSTLKNVEKYKSLYKHSCDMNESLEKAVEKSKKTTKCLEADLRKKDILIDSLRNEIEMLKEEIEKLKMRNKNLSENMELKEEMNLNLNFQLTEAKETIKEMEEAENFANSKKNQLPICLKEEIEKIEIYKITEDLEEKEDVIVKADGIVDGADFIVNEADVISDEDNVIVDEAEFEFDDIDICLQPQFTSSRKSAAFEENMEYYWMIHFSKNKASFILKENGRILRKDKIEPVTNVSKQLLELLILEKIFKLKINFIFNYSVTIVSNNHLEAIYGEDFATEYKNCLPLAKHVHSMLTKFISINIEVVSDDYVTKLFNDCLKIENG